MSLSDIIIKDTRDFISLEAPGGSRNEIRWEALIAADFETKATGSGAIDLWLVLRDDSTIIRIPLDHVMYEVVYSKVRMLKGFRWDNIITAFTSRQDATYELWRKKT